MARRDGDACGVHLGRLPLSGSFWMVLKICVVLVPVMDEILNSSQFGSDVEASLEALNNKPHQSQHY